MVSFSYFVGPCWGSFGGGLEKFSGGVWEEKALKNLQNIGRSQREVFGMDNQLQPVNEESIAELPSMSDILLTDDFELDL